MLLTQVIFVLWQLNSHRYPIQIKLQRGVISVAAVVVDQSKKSVDAYFCVVNLGFKRYTRYEAANIPKVQFDCTYVDSGTRVLLTKLGVERISRGAPFMASSSRNTPIPALVPILFQFNLGEYFVFKANNPVKVEAGLDSMPDRINFLPVETLP